VEISGSYRNLKKVNFFSGFIIGTCIAGAAAFLLPTFESKHPFFLWGFVACIVFVSLLSIAIWLWLRVSDQRGSRIGWLIPAIIFLAAIGSVLSFLLQHQLQLASERQAKWQSIQQTELIETTRNSGLTTMMGEILQDANREITADSQRRLSEQTIARIAALSYAFNPHYRIEGDTLSSTKLSRERGTLLLALTRLGMDSVSLLKLFQQATFANADLRKADLHGMILSHADMREANLNDANLERAVLQETNLWSANMWGINLQEADLRHAILSRADLSWSNLNKADFQEADLNGAKFTAAQMRKANLHKSLLQWADISGTSLHEANLTDADLYGAGLQRALLIGTDFSRANMKQANMVKADVTGANFTDADMMRTVVYEPDWIAQLPARNVVNASVILRDYTLVDESVGQKIEYCLERKKN
jgi:uncharacterized protein YjbI with pentapeptide repeats